MFTPIPTIFLHIRVERSISNTVSSQSHATSPGLHQQYGRSIPGPRLPFSSRTLLPIVGSPNSGPDHILAALSMAFCGMKNHHNRNPISPKRAQKALPFGQRKTSKINGCSPRHHQFDAHAEDAITRTRPPHHITLTDASPSSFFQSSPNPNPNPNPNHLPLTAGDVTHYTITDMSNES